MTPGAGQQELFDAAAIPVEDLPPDIGQRRQAVSCAAAGRLLGLPCVVTRAEFMSWLAGAHPGNRIIYFVGELAAFRVAAQHRIVGLQMLLDRATASHPMPHVALEIESISDQMELAAEVLRLAEAGAVHLTQVRLAKDCPDMAYIVAKGRRG